MKWLGFGALAIGIYLAWKKFNKLPDTLVFGAIPNIPGSIGLWNTKATQGTAATLPLPGQAIGSNSRAGIGG